MSIAGARELMEQVLLKLDITPKFCITLQVSGFTSSTNVAVAIILDSAKVNLLTPNNVTIEAIIILSHLTCIVIFSN